MVLRILCGSKTLLCRTVDIIVRQLLSRNQGRLVMNEEHVKQKEQLTEALEVSLKRLELEYELAQTGLKGTLIASLVALVSVMIFITVTVVVSPFTGKEILTGDQILIIVVALLAIVGICAFLYGTFVFRRLAKVNVDLNKRTVGLEAGDKV